MRGLSLGGVLLAVAVLSVLAFTLASLSVTHLQLSSRQEHGLAASNAARSVVSQAISRILQRKEFGEARLQDEEIRLESSDSMGFLTFHQAGAQRDGLPFSTNNLNKTENAHGADGVLVPSSTVHLVGVGRSGGVERRVEAVLRLPPFPWAIASGGRVETRNGVMIAALPHGIWPPPTDEDDLLPADLLANGRDPRAVVLATGSTVLGDVETPGQVVQANGVQVRGEIRSGSSEVALPTLKPAEYDPLTSGREHFTVTGTEDELTGSARGQGVLTFSQPLTLSNAHLFVEGDLNLPRGVSGTGVIVATGDISIGASANLEGMTELAVVSGGQVTLAGRGTERSHLRGLFYAEKGLRAADITLVGTLLTGSSSSGVELDRVNVFYEPPQDTSVSGTLTDGGIIFRIRGDNIPVSTDMSQWFSSEMVENDPEAIDPQTLMSELIYLYVDFQPTNGGYPLTLQFRGFWFQGGTDIGPQTIDNADQLDEVLSRFESLDIFGDSRYISDGLLARVKADLPTHIQDGGGTSSTSSGEKIDLSQFLPIEDRIRVVSWLER